MKRCFFIGHRDVSENIYPALEAAVERHVVEYGVTEFLVGHYGRFDRLAAKAVISAKAAHPSIRLTLLLPYHPAEQPVPTPLGFDGTFYPPNMEKVPRRLAIVQANRRAVEQADYLIAYVRYAGNADKLLAYANSRLPADRLCNLADVTQKAEGNR